MPGERRQSRGPGRIARPYALALGLAWLSGCATTGMRWPETTALSFLRTVQESNDPNTRYAAYDRLSNPNCYDDESQKARVAAVLSEKLKQGKEPDATRAVICRTLGMIGHPAARDAILVAIDREDDPLVKAQACRALGRVARPEDATILARIIATNLNSPECQVAAIESLGDLKPKEKRIIRFLVQGMEADEPVVRVACLKALRQITGQDLGVEALDWKKYLDKLPDDPVPKVAAEPIPVVPIAGNGQPILPPGRR